MKEIESHDATPEQLLQMLDAQLVARRSHRAQAGRNRATILVAGILFIVLAAGASLLVLDQMLMNLQSADRTHASGQNRIDGK
jgi:hypothetical protein